jgi:energy-coupling factor transporter ATP-binding protein EcfA2
MILQKFEYYESNGKTNLWKLNSLTLEKINLLVGKNATGKTRTIDRIAMFAGMLIDRLPISLEMIISAEFIIEFRDNDKQYNYILKTENRNIVCEKLEINGESKLERDRDGKGKIYYEDENRTIGFELSANRLALVAKRDKLQHPFLENIFQWAEGLRLYRFGSSSELGQRNMLATNNLENSISEDHPHDTIRINEIFLRGKNQFGNNFIARIIKYMQAIGYDISDVSVDENPYIAIYVEDNSPLNMLSVKENDRNANLFQTGMSGGMFRAFSLIIQLTYNLLSKSSTTILIDDIGEGLDFERSSGIIKLITRLAEESSTQIIMSTNDRFVMNNVPFKYWQVIQRSGGECTVFNYQNSKDKFDDFKFTGLNNFDFLRTDWLNQKWEEV